MSVLASEGIAVFQDKHFVVKKSKSCDRYSRLTTHAIAWQTLNYWSTLKNCADLLSRSIRINGIELRDWLHRFPAKSSFRAIGNRWLRAWGLDLQTFSLDRDMRNEASYRPTSIQAHGVLPLTDTSNFISELWTLCEPTEGAAFHRIDRHLLRLVLEQTFFDSRGVRPQSDMTQFQKDLSAMLLDVGIDPSSHQLWIDFLTRTVEADDPLVFSEAQKAPPTSAAIGDSTLHLQMISRAALLLRVATAANSKLLRESGMSAHEIAFWRSNVADERGIWPIGNEPGSLSDLWADIEDAIGNLDAWKERTLATDQTFIHWRNQCAYDISVLGTCERIALWGLSP
ncbi:MAG TPA: hypothetical protein VFO34_00770 [Candidatus Acidoferrales bacterium]|nr:hypothetical protein [Candidatus Acidoferrales bacterium]